MRTSLNGHKLLALLLGPISLLTLAAALNSSLASAEPHVPQTTAPVAEFSPGAEVPVPPWCTWHSSIPENVLLAPVKDPANDTVYRGNAINLAFSSDWNYTYVGGEVGQTAKAKANKCSWFGSPPFGSQLNVEITSNDFNAYIKDGNHRIADKEMNFELSSSNNFTLTRQLDTTCADPGNSFTSTDLHTNLTRQPAPAQSTLMTVSAASTFTNNFCRWKANYAVKIPAGLLPTYTRADYIWVGPQILYTLSFPAE